MDIRKLRAAFDDQVRRNTTVLMPGVAEISAAAGVLRQLAIRGQGRSGIAWSDLDEHSADEAIAAQVDFFRRRGEEFDWQLLGYDQPAGLGERLIRAGFVPDEEEVLLFAETARVAREMPPPDGIRLVEVRDAAGVEAAASTQEDLRPGPIHPQREQDHTPSSNQAKQQGNSDFFRCFHHRLVSSVNLQLICPR